MKTFTAILETENLIGLKRVAISRGWQEQVWQEGEELDGLRASGEMIDNPITSEAFIIADFPTYLFNTYLAPAYQPEVQGAVEQARQMATEASKESIIPNITVTIK